MSRPLPTLLSLLLLLGLAVLLAPLSVAGDEDVARIASDEEIAEAMARFKTEYKARGLQGDEKLSQRDFAMSELALLHHPEVVKALTKIAKGSDSTLRVLAVIYLGQQTELPGLAGPVILKTMKKNAKEPILVLSALQSLGNLRYYGAVTELGARLKDKDFAVKKASIQAIGQIGEMRLWKEILRLAGVEVKSGKEKEGGGDVNAAGDNSKEEVVEEGYSYEGVEVTYDTGSAGDGDQQMAEKIGKEKLAANKAAAEKAAAEKNAANKAKAANGASFGGGAPGASSSATGKGAVARDPKELLPFVLRTLWLLTGERFQNSKEVAQWVMKNRETIRDRVHLLDELEKAQIEDAKSFN